jgi:hypothetical protein
VRARKRRIEKDEGEKNLLLEDINELVGGSSVAAGGSHEEGGGTGEHLWGGGREGRD